MYYYVLFMCNYFLFFILYIGMYYYISMYNLVIKFFDYLII